MGKRRDLNWLINLFEEADSEKGIPYDTLERIPKEIIEEYRAEKNKGLAESFNAVLKRAIESDPDGDLCIGASYVVYAFSDPKMLDVIKFCLALSRNPDTESQIVNYGILALQNILINNPDNYESVLLFVELDQEELLALEYFPLLSDLEKIEPIPFFYRFLANCHDKSDLEVFVSWLIGYFENRYNREIEIIHQTTIFTDIDKLARIENPNVSMILERHITDKDQIAKSYALRALAYSGNSIVIKPSFEIIEKNFGEYSIPLSSAQAALKAVAGTEELGQLFNIMRQYDAQIKKKLARAVDLDEKSKGDSEEANALMREAGAYHAHKFGIADIIGEIEKRGPTRFRNECIRIIEKAVGKNANNVDKFPLEYIHPFLLNGDLMAFVKKWNPTAFYRDSGSKKVAKFLNNNNVVSDEKYAAEYDSDGKILKKWVSKERLPETKTKGSIHSENIEKWHYCDVCNELKDISNPSREACNIVGELLGNLGLLPDTKKKAGNSIVCYVEGIENAKGEKAASIFRAMYLEYISKVMEKTATTHECSFLLSTLLAWINKKSTSKRSLVIRKMEEIPPEEEEKLEFRVEEWDRNIWHGAFGCSKEAAVCVLPGGQTEEACIDFITNRAISFLDYYIAFENSHIRVNRAILDKTYAPDDNKELGIKKNTPVLLVDSVQGIGGALSCESQHTAIIDYAKDRGYKFVLFNENASNVNSLRFRNYIRAKSTTPKRVSIKLNLLDIGIMAKKIGVTYTDAWASYKTPKGEITGYLEEL